MKAITTTLGLFIGFLYLVGSWIKYRLQVTFRFEVGSIQYEREGRFYSTYSGRSKIILIIIMLIILFYSREPLCIGCILLWLLFAVAVEQHIQTEDFWSVSLLDSLLSLYNLCIVNTTGIT